MVAKTLYLDHRFQLEEQLRINNDVKGILQLQKARARYEKWSKYWSEADLDDVVNRLVPNAEIDSTSSMQKIIFSSIDSEYKIVCDKAGSYFRIIKEFSDKYGIHQKYVGLDGKDIKKIVNDKNLNITKDDFNKFTHFKMIKKKVNN